MEGQSENLGGDRPTKVMPSHSAFYETLQHSGAVVHLHRILIEKYRKRPAHPM